ncbi:MAG: glycosyltransferase family 2 protein [Parachlamydiales bacterium]|nr:glycosyltransferase family 2 protein [Parachlamydiales bacterium]
MISVCILTKNAAATLKATLDSVRSFDEVILLDNGSTDDTIAIAKTFPNVQIHMSPFIGFGPLRNEAARLARHDWILSLDSDEVLSPALLAELETIQLHPQNAYFFPRHNYYNKKRIKGCGWDPEQIARLYNRNFAKFSSSQVHEKLEANHFTRLSSPILHTPYRSTADFLAKMQHYSTLFAEQYRGKRRSSFAIAMAHAVYAFFRSYILKRGLFCGKEGFLISLYNANTTLYKYLKLAELNNLKI